MIAPGALDAPDASLEDPATATAAGAHEHVWARGEPSSGPDAPSFVDDAYTRWPAPLACTVCGAPWPGYALPVPAHDRPGYGELAQLPSWSSRVDAMVADLGTIDDAA